MKNIIKTCLMGSILVVAAIGCANKLTNQSSNISPETIKTTQQKAAAVAAKLQEAVDIGRIAIPGASELAITIEDVTNNRNLNDITNKAAALAETANAVVSKSLNSAPQQ